MAQKTTVEADLLVVGGTESGCAAALQAARMGVKQIVLVNDIQWLGGQFSAEGLGAIDENRAHGYDGTVPIPRSGIFRDVIDAIENQNAELYGGVRRPGNTRVITTARPVVSEKVFRELLAPREESGQVRRFSDYRVQSVLTKNHRVCGVQFVSADSTQTLTVRAALTIDATDWGDVIRGAGARWDAGLDAKSEFGEPSAPESGEPKTDLNPITWCMILEQRKTKAMFSKPAGYDPGYFNQQWGWIDEQFAYSTRRLVDGQGFEEINHPNILLINNPSIDYPLDVYPADVAAALEATETGASKKNIVAMTPQQREIVFQDARKHSLKYYYHLQRQFPKFRYMALSEEFGTSDRLPPKPYIRESLRLVAKHIVREQEVAGFGSRSNYAKTMFPDAVFSWQFELDFHPTKRSWMTGARDKGPWEAVFRGNRRFGRGGTGRCVFPMRGTHTQRRQRVIGGSKEPRLHQHRRFILPVARPIDPCGTGQRSRCGGQFCGTIRTPAEFYLQPQRMAEVWSGLLEVRSGAPLVIWPFADVDPFDPGFVAIQQLALRRLLPLGPSDTRFHPGRSRHIGVDQRSDGDPLARPVTNRRRSSSRERKKDETLRPSSGIISSRNQSLSRFASRSSTRTETTSQTPMIRCPFTIGSISWKVEPDRDGIPDLKAPRAKGIHAFNFTSAKGSTHKGFQNDVGHSFNDDRGFGWRSDLSKNTRLRNIDDQPLRDGFVFTRQQDVWECKVANGRWKVQVCLGDSGHPQPGQHLSIEGQVAAANTETAAGQFHEVTSTATVRDGYLTLTLGVPEGGSNTCINWVTLESIEPAAKHEE